MSQFTRSIIAYRPAGYEETQFFGISIADWVKTIHHRLVNQRGENEEDLEYVIAADDYGFDSYACIIGVILSNIKVSDEMDSLREIFSTDRYMEIAHAEWKRCYTHWKNITNSVLSLYYEESINTVERNKKAVVCAADLAVEDQQIYKDIIHEIFAILAVRKLEAGMRKVAL
jgi:hypothetical protein